MNGTEATLAGLLKNMLSLRVSLDSVVFTAKWMVLWPIAILQMLVIWRAIKSFLPKN